MEKEGKQGGREARDERNGERGECEDVKAGFHPMRSNGY